MTVRKGVDRVLDLDRVRDEVRSITGYFDYLAKSFHATGNSVLADKLCAQVNRLVGAVSDLEDIKNDVFHAYIDGVEAASQNVFRAALAGVALAEKSKKPRYGHDCDDCVFLGWFKEYDLYFCSQSSIQTVLARFGNVGSACITGIESSGLPSLREAVVRAKACGLMKDKEG